MSDGAGGIFAVTDVLQEAGQLRSAVTVPLVGNLVADAPHHDTGIVAELVNQVHQVFFRPFVKYLMITVLQFGCFPFVERFGHNHHTHFVARTDQFGSRHIVGSADSVTTHIFQDAYLAADPCFVGNAAQRAEVVMIAHTFKCGTFTVQIESLVRDDFDRTDTERRGIFVFQRIAFIHFGHCRIERRRIGRPECRVVYHEMLVEYFFVVFRTLLFVGSYHFAVGSFQFGHDAIVGERLARRDVETCFQVDSGEILLYDRRGELRPPCRDMGVFVNHQMNVAVQACARIPA